MDIVFVHGYNVTSTSTYGVLPQRLKSLGHTVKNVYLGKYVTLDNDVTIPDIVRGFQAALEDVYGAQFGKKKFACITHSTGGLVARGWVDTYYRNRKNALPMSHLIMLAPPNNGSRLATLGKSRLSRLRSLWGVEPGIQVLNALELGSQYQHDLNVSWAHHKIHNASGFFPFVIMGQWIDKKLWDTIAPATYERGSDGVVRAAAANLNTQKFVIHQNGAIKKEVLGGIPFLVTPKTSHSNTDYGIMGSIPKRGDHPAFAAILKALKIKDRRSYQALEADMAMQTHQLQRRDVHFDGSQLDRYCQLIFQVTDNMGNALKDYAVELIDAEGRGDRFPSGFVGHIRKNAVNPEFMTFYLNYDKLAHVKGVKIGFRVQSYPDTPLVEYKTFEFIGNVSAVGNWLKPNQTTWVQVVLRRRLNKNIFRLTKNFSKQKIQIKAGPDWIN
jgi:hypothetical protein